MKQVPLPNGKFALVSEEDFDWLMQWKWHYTADGYVKRSIWSPSPNGVYMSREIAERAGMDIAGRHVDHRDRNTLNNQRDNLRPASCAQNNVNAKIRVDNTSGEKGVCWDKNRGKWMARVWVNGKAVWQGRFDSFAEAVSRRSAMAAEVYGEFAA